MTPVAWPGVYTHQDERLVGIEWLPRIRWIGLAVLLLLTALIGAAEPGLALSPWVWAVFGTGVLSNLLLALRRGELDDRFVAALLALDIGLLTALLGVTGGDANPFVLLYLFPVVVAALFVRPAVTWSLFALATAAYASLFWFAPSDLDHHDEAAMRNHLLGMFAAYVLAAALITFAVHRVLTAKAAASERLAHAREIEERNRRLASLATLAAGAAHELGSPLSTILVVGRELERTLAEPHQADLALLRAEVLRCQDIVALLSGDVGTGIGEASRPSEVRALLQRAVDGLAVPGLTFTAGEGVVNVPVELVTQVLRRLIGNAADATPPGREIRVSGELRGDALFLGVADRGAGMSAEVLDRATEPFFTTNGAGHRGLGLYFVQSVVSQLGGTLSIDSAPGEGTTVEVRLPRAAG